MFKINDFELSTVVKYTDYFVSDHRVHDIRIMPGVTLFDIVYRALTSENVDTRNIELRNILFKEPIIVAEDYDRELTIKFKNMDEHSIVTVYSKRIRDGVALDDKVENYRAEIHNVFNHSMPSIDIQSLKEKAIKVIDLKEYYANTRKLNITHYEYMRALGNIYRGEDYLLAEIHLSKLAQEHLKHYYLHPVYLDASTLISLSYHHERLFSDDPKPCIPIFIESFWAAKDLEETCYVYVKESDINYLTTKDIYYSGLGIYDKNGQISVQLNRLAAKQVRSEELLRNIEQGIKASRTDNNIKKLEAVIEQNNIAESNTANESNTKVSSDEELVKLIQNNIFQIIIGLKGANDEDINIELGFYDQGLDSENLLEIIGIIENELGEQLYPTLLFEYINIQELAQYLMENYKEACRNGWIFSKDSKCNEVEIDTQLSISDNKLIYLTKEWKLKDIVFNDMQKIATDIILFSRKTVEDSELERKIRSTMDDTKKLIVAYLGNEYKEIDDYHVEIDLSNDGDCCRFINELVVKGIYPKTIIYSATNKLNQVNNQVYGFFNTIKNLITSNIKGDIHVLYVYASKQGADIYNKSIEAFMKSIRLEKTNISYKIIENIDSLASYENEIINELISQEDINKHIRYSQEGRYINVLNQQSSPINTSGLPLKQNGVYLITGGMGGIGYNFACHIAKSVNARLIIVGRSKVNEKIKSKIENLEKMGADVHYYTVEISEKEEVEKLIKRIKGNVGQIDGIIHGAGIVLDSLIINKTEQEFREVLKAKVEGSINLDELTREETLDFMILFSSTAAITGNIGQADYAYANSFLDNYAEYREDLRKKGLCSGKTLAINWPFWEHGGMKVNKQTQMNMKNKLGMEPISNEEGINALETAFNMEQSQILVMKGNKRKIENYMEINTQNSEQNQNPSELMRFNQKDNTIIGDEDIAIIGLSGKYPMSDNLKEFWENLKKGRDCITEIPSDRWDYEKYFDEDKNKVGTTYSKWGGFINDVDKFDPMFFNISPKEAKIMDPQERIFLETVWHTIEDAGYDCSNLSGKDIGVYAGVMWGQYQLIQSEIDGRVVSPTVTYSSIANRISYIFNFNGPSMAIDTMCSSSLTAIHLACESIKKGECEMAIAGGVNLTLHPNKYIFLSQQKFASTDGKCRSFGDGGDGYVPGEGVGAVFLKPLSKAIQDKDNIYGVIKGTSLNHGGNTSGYTVPSPIAQEKVIEEALQKSKIDPSTISYIEAHGTGTSLGDPIEISGISKAFKKHTDKKGYCSIGSVKSNIGHLEAAAGIASVTKVLLQMKYKKLVPSIHAKRLNPNIDFSQTPCYVQQEYTDWIPALGNIDEENDENLRKSGISAFGAGGSNVHIIVEEFPYKHQYSSQVQDEYAVVISAKNTTGIKEYAEEYIKFIDEYSNDKVKAKKDFNATFESILEQLKHMTSEIIDIDFDELDKKDTIREIGLDLFSCMRLKEQLAFQYEVAVDLDYDVEDLSLGSIAKSICKGKDIVIEDSFDNLIPQHVYLEQIAYVSQVGRKHMDERVAFLTSSLDQLRKQLKVFVENNEMKTDITQHKIFSGNIKHFKGMVLDENLDYALKGKNLETLVDIWTKGGTINWSKLYQGNKPWKTSIPVYPFQKKRYWIGSYEEEKDKKKEKNNEIIPKLKPSHREISNFEKELLVKAEQYDGEEVTLEIINTNIAIVRMEDRKNKNVFSNEMIHGLMKRFMQIKQNPNIKAVILTGYDNVFCMGGTQEQLVDISDRKYKFSDVPFLHRGLLETEIPVISAIQGHASGGGLLFGLYADIVIMAEEGTYSAVFMKYGFTPGMGATMILKERFGVNIATEMMFTARTYTGQDLKNRNATMLFKRNKDVLNEAISVAKMLVEKPLNTLKVLKKELAGRILKQLPDIIESENLMHELTFSNDEVKKRIDKYYVKWHDDAPNQSDDEELLKILDMVEKGELTPQQAKRLRSLII